MNTCGGNLTLTYFILFYEHHRRMTAMKETCLFARNNGKGKEWRKKKQFHFFLFSQD